MVTLNITDAIEIVRKNCDEYGVPVEQFGSDLDDGNFGVTVARTLPEAINAVNTSAPAYMLEGSQQTATNVQTGEDNVLSFEVDADIIRLTAFQVSSSPVVLTSIVPEDSAEGRKQLNQYVRGTYDNPVLVQKQGKIKPYKFAYYSCVAATDAITRCEFVTLQQYAPGTTSYQVAADLYWPVINQLTAMVLVVYGELEKAKIFFERANLQ